jgi:hypothetical protein
MTGWKSHIAPYIFSSQIWQVMRVEGMDQWLQNSSEWTHAFHIEYLLFEVWRNSLKGTGSSYIIYCTVKKPKNLIKLRGLSQRANYTDRAITACRRSYHQLLRIRGKRNDSLGPYSRLSGPEPLLSLASGSSSVLTRLGGPRSIPATSQKIW